MNLWKRGSMAGLENVLVLLKDRKLVNGFIGKQSILGKQYILVSERIGKVSYMYAIV